MSIILGPTATDKGLSLHNEPETFNESTHVFL